MMHRGFLRIASLLGALTVVIGAFAAHGLKKIFTPDQIALVETGVRYQFYHTIALFIAAILYREYSGSLVTWAGRLFQIGILLFSGSLYLLAWIQSAGLTDFTWVGAITPFGGLSFIAGWICLFLAAGRKS